jgi:hypothetical protein
MDVIPTEALDLHTDSGKDLAAGVYRRLSEADLEL